MSSELFWIFGPITLVIVFCIISTIDSKRVAAQKKADEERLKKRIQSIPEFTISNMVTGCNNAGIACDETRRKICLFKSIYEFNDFELRNIHSSEIRVFDFRDILSAEIIENGETVTRTETKSKSRLGSAVVGGVLFGGAGAIVGGLTGKSESASTSTNYVTQIDLKIIVKDTKNPVHIISFLSGTTGKQSGLYKSTIQKAMKWQAIMNVLISQADEKDYAKVEIEEFANEPPQKNNIMVSAEIYKLLELMNQGVITEQEFEAQKKKLLAS